MIFFDRYGRQQENYRCLGRCVFKGGSSTTVNNTTTYTPTEYELQLQRAQANYADAIAPNSLWLNDTARNILQNSIGAVQVDFNGLNNKAQNQINEANAGLKSIIGSNNAITDNTNSQIGKLTSQYANAVNKANTNLGNYSDAYAAATENANNALGNLVNGELPSNYQSAMENSIVSALNRTMGTNINNLTNRGVLNSSIASKAINDISRNAADTVAQQYSNNINNVAGLVGQQLSNINTSLGAQSDIANNQFENSLTGINKTGDVYQQQLNNVMNANNANAGILNNAINNATAGITTAAAAQEAAQQPALNLWNASLGLNGSTTSALAAAAGKGTTQSSSTQSTSGGGGFFSGLLGGL